MQTRKNGTFTEVHVLMVLKRGHLHGGWMHNGCVRLAQKLLPAWVESGHSSVYPSSLTGLLVQLNISSCLSLMIHFYILCRLL